MSAHSMNTCFKYAVGGGGEFRVNKAKKKSLL